jgi:xanthine dehydrogenase small subunit
MFEYIRITHTTTSDEIIDSISFDIPDKNSFFNFEKVSKRTHLDIASVNSAILINVENKKIANAFLSVGGVAPIPLYLEKTSAFLESQILSDSLILETINTALSEISPISDIRGSAEYKSLLTQQLIKAHFIELFPSIISSEVVV